jgi:hypothetical protein
VLRVNRLTIHGSWLKPQALSLDCTEFGRSDIVAGQLNTLFLSRVAEGQARRSHGNHATGPQVAVRCQFLPSPDSEGEMREDQEMSFDSFLASGNSPGQQLSGFAFNPSLYARASLTPRTGCPTSSEAA